MRDTRFSLEPLPQWFGRRNLQGDASARLVVRSETKDNVFLALKSVLFVLGGVLAVAGMVDLVVGGPSVGSAVVLVVGLFLAGSPLALAFADAVRHGRERL